MTNQPAPQPTNDLRQALASAAQKLAAALNDLQALEVITQGTEIKAGKVDKGNLRLIASTKIELDGDTTFTIPLVDENGALVVDQALLEVHLGSVQNAIDYRQQLLEMVVDFVRQARR